MNYSTPPSVAGATFAPQISVKSSENLRQTRAFWIHDTAQYHQTDKQLHRTAGRKIGAVAVAVFDYIASWADFETGEACPPVEMIATDLRITPPTVTKCINLLIKCKMLTKRTTRWGNAEQGPKARNFYKVLRSTLWDFSSVPDKVKAVRKQKKVDSNEVSTTNTLHRDFNHESQESSSKVNKPNLPVLASSINEEIGDGTLTQRLLATGLAPAYVEQVAAEIPGVCELALTDLAKSRTSKRNLAGWMRNTIEAMRHRHGVTPEGYAPSEADLAIQAEKSAPSARPIVPTRIDGLSPIAEILTGFTPPPPLQTEEVSIGDIESEEDACDKVFQGLPEDEKEQICEAAREALKKDRYQSFLATMPSSPKARAYRLRFQRETVRLNWPERVESLMNGARLEVQS